MKKLFLVFLMALASVSVSQLAFAAKKGGKCFSSNQGDSYKCAFIDANKSFTIEDLYNAGYRVVTSNAPSNLALAYMLIIEQQ